MNYVTHNTHDIDTNMSCLQGHITCPFSLLVNLFGEPVLGEMDKIDAMWAVQFDDGITATIYNWKNGIAYCGSLAPEVEQITKWNIGGYDQLSSDHVRNIILSKEIAA